jgi:hypothetical protein
MMDYEKIDLSSLDPSTDQERWNGLIDAIVKGAVRARRKRSSVTYQLLAWARPAMAVAAAVAMTVVIGASLNRDTPRSSLSKRAKPALLLAEWATTDKALSTATMVELLGGARGSK